MCRRQPSSRSGSSRHRGLRLSGEAGFGTPFRLPITLLSGEPIRQAAPGPRQPPWQPVEKAHPVCVRPLWPNDGVALPPRIQGFASVARLVFGHNDSASPAERLYQRTATAATGTMPDAAPCRARRCGRRRSRRRASERSPSPLRRTCPATTPPPRTPEQRNAVRWS